MRITGPHPRWDLPVGLRATCQQCGAQVVWAMSDLNNKIAVDFEPVNPAFGDLVLWYQIDLAGDPVDRVQYVSPAKMFPEYEGQRWRAHHLACPIKEGGNHVRRG